ncbi:RNA polymerase sigma factor [Cellulomonas gelida]|uniref:DNA-directed RNA polymerase sigma-70 factor n=1 Tax=Cellulomonas gelida TaxID=1712 RepID=A0A4Y3KPH1_9CELL|nr:sigma-70 family RNA polymerase sigma factor [Cellulomonas gelida]GEA84830.1 DNA-directed RNA polymerase sigma-70 factor [Cellulomonas gelida]
MQLVQPANGVESFARAHGPELRRIAIGICRNVDAADDLVQDTLARLLQKHEAFARATNQMGYARTVMVRMYLDGRDPHVHASTSVELTVDRSAAQPFDEIEGIDAVIQMVALLSPRARAVLALRYVADLDDKEIASTLGVTRSTVRVTAHRALTRLRVTGKSAVPEGGR